ncbi:MAG TPA: MmpS family transport accessory protein [Mycobacterium sp.]|nr:MmpS family transport accessory protein [Mycobacterium sp.]HQE14394.1 MmpS family transport accessory protein [Mycobacterium sp.]
MSEPRQWSDQTGSSGYPANTDPAYSGQYWTPGYYGHNAGQNAGCQNYPQGYGAPMNQPTEQLPAYWQPGYQAGPPPPPPLPPKSPRWLWIVAAAAVLLVAGLVLALVIVSNSARESTTVAPANPSTTSPRTTAPTRTPTTTRAPLPTVTFLPGPSTTPPGTTEPTIPGGPDQTTPPGATETVVYSVTGEGRAINITYVDTGGVMQTEFNVALPWSKEVSLSAPAKTSASVAVVNVGRDVTCSVSVDGAQVRQRTGRGLTICSGLG